MLGSYPVDVMLLATDLGVARSFYGDILGLPVLVEDTQFLTFGCGGDSRLVVTKSTTGPREEATKASWRVDDLAGEVAWLQGRGVPLEDLPELGTVDGIADIGFALAAWFVDPDHNWIGLLQLKEPGVRPRGAATGAGQADAPAVPGAETKANQHMAKAVQAGQQAPNGTGRSAAIPRSPAGPYQWPANHAAREPALPQENRHG
jgi:catechol 2,3-dioxygenase-like lactoylglutathione lyase family enzyme